MIGGYAVGYYGYPRSTGDMDVWIARNSQTATKMVSVLLAFGFSSTEVNADLFLKERRLIRMGVPPVRIELLTSITGIEFSACYPERTVADLDGIPVPIISLNHLKANKQKCGRPKDLDDLKNLP